MKQTQGLLSDTCCWNEIFCETKFLRIPLTSAVKRSELKEPSKNGKKNSHGIPSRNLTSFGKGKGPESL